VCALLPESRARYGRAARKAQKRIPGVKARRAQRKAVRTRAGTEACFQGHQSTPFRRGHSGADDGPAVDGHASRVHLAVISNQKLG